MLQELLNDTMADIIYFYVFCSQGFLYTTFLKFKINISNFVMKLGKRLIHLIKFK